MHVEPGMRLEPLHDRGALVRAVVVADQVHVEVLGDLDVDLYQELLELDGAVASVQGADHRAIGDVQSREQAGGAVPRVVVGPFSGMPGIIGNAGCERASAWIWLFSSTLSTTAVSGGSSRARRHRGPSRRTTGHCSA